MCSAFGEPRVTTCVNVLNQNRNAALHDLDGNRWFCSGIAGAQPHTTKRLRLIAIRFGSDQVSIRASTPKVGSAGVEKGTRQYAERLDQTARIVALKSSPRKIEEKFLEGNVRLRRVAWSRVSAMTCQCAPISELSD